MARIHPSGKEVPVEIYDDSMNLTATMLVTESETRVVDRVRGSRHREITRILLAGRDKETIEVLRRRNPSDLGTGTGCTSLGVQTTVDLQAGHLQYRDYDRIVLLPGQEVKTEDGFFAYEAEKIMIFPPAAEAVITDTKSPDHPLQLLFKKMTADMMAIVAKNTTILKDRGDDNVPLRCNDPDF